MSEMSTRFDFKNIEKKWCRYWEDGHIFHTGPVSNKKPYSIVIPPPNVTGILHMGHALNNTLQDIIIRYKRMQGYETCWMPGTDHAGIATQNVVEKQLAKEGKTRHDLGREKLLERLWQWKKEYGDTIINQLKKIGSSCDWDRTRFTMDEQYSLAVRKVFVDLFKKGLIYRGEYIINWCPRCHTALSDEEAEYQEHQGALYHIKYPFKDNPQRSLVVATTRPETMLGDTAVAVNPSDPRYTALIGKILILPIVNREIPIIPDDFVDPEFGTGAVKVTPAHDPNDFLIGKRHKLPVINIMHPDGRMNENAGEDFSGLDRFEAREAITEMLHELKVLEKVEQHSHAVGHCYRCHTVIEPYLSKQWFVKMAPLAKPALKVVTDGKIKFYPERWTKVYCHWLENIRDWCISRQIWWGHRIPVWYCQDCDETIVSMDDPSVCPKCNSHQLKQDEDVLDTWFSSWLWPFATFGWPDTSKDLDYFYPTNSLFTASEIIFFWVARMIMAGLEFMGEIPFSDIFIHGTVRDSQGRKMSKSLGNAIDPLEIIDEYGADALRFSLIINSGQDIYISKDKFEIGRNFANKIWNASRLILMNVKTDNRNISLESLLRDQDLDTASRWIISKFNSTLKGVNNALELYRFSEAENLIYEFFWSNFCDWYLEIIKQQFDNPKIQQVALKILESSIRMIHPFMPFVTEEVWSHLGVSDNSLSHIKWPEYKPVYTDIESEQSMGLIIGIIAGIRTARVQWNIKSGQSTDIHLSAENPDMVKTLKNNEHIFNAFLKINKLVINDEGVKIKNAASGIIDKVKYQIPLEDIIDIDKEIRRMKEDAAVCEKHAADIQKRLSNHTFIEKAPTEVVERDKERLNSISDKIKNIQDVLSNLD
ncbi:MAG: valine--tRNA ligase [Candidatus Omnitrophota bacterium]